MALDLQEKEGGRWEEEGLLSRLSKGSQDADRGTNKASPVSQPAKAKKKVSVYGGNEEEVYLRG